MFVLLTYGTVWYDALYELDTGCVADVVGGGRDIDFTVIAWYLVLTAINLDLYTTDDIIEIQIENLVSWSRYISTQT